MIQLTAFLDELAAITDVDLLLDFCRRRALHGNPAIFEGNEDSYYQFRKRIADQFSIHFHEVFITGSAKLGFSPFKKKTFDYDSDIDVAIISGTLYDRMMEHIYEYQMQLRESRKSVSADELGQYHRFLEYSAIGWMRPDLLPYSFRVDKIRQEWFSYFNSISYGKSEVGDYKVTGGAFKSYDYLERYTVHGLASLQSKLEVERLHDSAN